jgi:hypothetical protein
MSYMVYIVLVMLELSVQYYTDSLHVNIRKQVSPAGWGNTTTRKAVQSFKVSDIPTSNIHGFIKQQDNEQ